MQKQTKLQQLPRLVMAVTLIVMFGALFGVVGYLASHQQKPIVPFINPVAEKEITITTDKMEYESMEDIKASIENNTDDDIFLLNFKFEQWQVKDGNEWVYVKNSIMHGISPKLDKKIPAKNKITENVYFYNFFSSSGEQFPIIGKPYRIAEAVYFQCKNIADLENLEGCNKKIIYSNGFKFKEKSAVDPRCGQKVKGTGVCEGKLIDDIGYQFNSEIGKCIEKAIGGTGCRVETPFTSLEECQKVCEKRYGKNLEFETIEKKSYSGNSEKRNYVVKNSKEWNDLWIKKIVDKRMVPYIDFDKDMIIAVFQGEKTTGGYSIEINRITEKENVIEVSILETSPGPGCMVTKMLTSPYHIVKLAKQTKEIKFNVTEMTNNCEAYSQ